MRHPVVTLAIHKLLLGFGNTLTCPLQPNKPLATCDASKTAGGVPILAVTPRRHSTCQMCKVICSMACGTWCRQAWQRQQFQPLASRDTVSELLRVLGLPKIRNADDLIFLELAVVSQADALVSGDADLQVLREQFQIPILTLAEFEQWLQA